MRAFLFWSADLQVRSGYEADLEVRAPLMILAVAFRPLQRHAAIDHQHLAGDVAGVRTHQEPHGMADVPACALDLQHRGLGALRAGRLAHAVAASIDHGRVDRTGTDAVDP